MSDIPLKLIVTGDGSHSLYRDDLHESYHSLHGARSESMHVFIEHGLQYVFAQRPSVSIQILEVGLGTGLNAMLTADWAASQKRKVCYVGLEPVPVPESISSQLNFFHTAEEETLLRKIHAVPWEENVEIDDHFTLLKTQLTLENYQHNHLFHLIYFDAFAPSKQAAIWSMENIKKCYDLLVVGGVLVTYCAQGQFKRDLKSAGFELEILPGALGKKEMTRAVKKNF